VYKHIADVTYMYIMQQKTEHTRMYIRQHLLQFIFIFKFNIIRYNKLEINSLNKVVKLQREFVS